MKKNFPIPNSLFCPGRENGTPNAKERRCIFPSSTVIVLLEYESLKKMVKLVLREIKQNNKFDNISIIILTASILDIENDPYAKLADAVFIKIYGIGRI